MAFKHQAKCYRNIGGKKYANYCDLVMGDEENAKAEKEAKSNFFFVKKIKHHSGEYYQLFVSND